jgi:hypothetical protein
VSRWSLNALQDRSEEDPGGGESVPAAVEPALDAYSDTQIPRRVRSLPCTSPSEDLKPLRITRLLRRPAVDREERVELPDRRRHPGVETGREHDGPLELAQGETAKRRHRVRLPGRARPAALVDRAVELGHDVHVDVTGDQSCPDPLLERRPLRPGGERKPAPVVGRQRGRVGEEREVALDALGVVEPAGLKLVELARASRWTRVR